MKSCNGKPDIVPLDQGRRATLKLSGMYGLALIGSLPFTSMPHAPGER